MVSGCPACICVPGLLHCGASVTALCALQSSLTPTPSQLNIQAKQVEPQVEGGAQVQQVINIECLADFLEAPLLNIKFRCERCLFRRSEDLKFSRVGNCEKQWDTLRSGYSVFPGHSLRLTEKSLSPAVSTGTMQSNADSGVEPRVAQGLCICLSSWPSLCLRTPIGIVFNRWISLKSYTYYWAGWVLFHFCHAPEWERWK